MEGPYSKVPPFFTFYFRRNTPMVDHWSLGMVGRVFKYVGRWNKQGRNPEEIHAFKYDPETDSYHRMTKEELAPFLG